MPVPAGGENLPPPFPPVAASSLPFPDTGTKVVLLPNGRPAIGQRGYLYEDVDLTVPAEVYRDVNGTKGSLITPDGDGRVHITLDAYGAQVPYWGPADGQDYLYIVVNGVAWRVDADYNKRLDAVQAQLASVMAYLNGDE